MTELVRRKKTRRRTISNTKECKQSEKQTTLNWSRLKATILFMEYVLEQMIRRVTWIKKNNKKKL